VGPEKFIAGESVDLRGAGALLLAGFLWAFGSIYSRQVSMPPEPLLSTAIQMLAGGALLSIAGALNGDWVRIEWSEVSWRSIWALAYLIVFGSWIGFSAYVWLLRVSTPARVSTYAYVNPIVAIMLGWAIDNEKLDVRVLIAGTIIIAAVAFITTARSRPIVGKTRGAIPVELVPPPTGKSQVVLTAEEIDSANSPRARV
ncbi:MAG TPA: EamA family transporter, partial [Phycisphaerae bacterium]|nr:EamA family transporter [Phycisphaerae bacterium]